MWVDSDLMASRIVQLKDHASTPLALKKVNGVLTWFWLLNLPAITVAYFVFPGTWEKASIFYLAVLSVWANIASHFAGWIAGRVEVNQED